MTIKTLREKLGFSKPRIIPPYKETMTPTERQQYILEKMGFPDSEQGSYVKEFRKLIERQVSEGMQNRSYGTWARDDLTCEERARALLEVEWALQRKHSAKIKMLDSPVRLSINTKTQKRRLIISWRTIPAYVGDRFRVLGMKWRIFRDKYILKIKNPYALDADGEV